MRRVQIRALTTGSAVALAVATIATPAAAQTEDQQVAAQQPETNAQAPQAGAPSDDEAIVVTGSRIARPNFDTIEPAVVINSEQIEARGFETLGQALNELPAFGVPGSSPVGGQSSFGPGQNFVNFLGLGSERTLTLVNGRRFVGSNTASIFGPTGQGGNQVDLNVIPTKLIDRVETIVIGGAPIYGSDAIAGTVNVILRRDYDGIEIDGQYGISTRGDAANYRFRALAGTNFGDGRGNITIAGEYNRGEGLIGLQRPDLYNGRFFAGDNNANAPFTNIIYPDRRIPTISQNGLPTRFDFIPLTPQQQAAFGLAGQAGFRDAQGNVLVFDAAGNLVPLVFGAPTGVLVGGLPTSFEIDFSGGNGFSLNDTSTNLLTDTERYSANILLSYKLTDHIRAFGEGWYSRSRGVNLQDQPEYNSYLFGYAGEPAGAVVLSTSNPFLSPQARALIQAQTSSAECQASAAEIGLTCDPNFFLLQRANTDLITGRATGSVEIWRGVFGFDGSFNSFNGREWNFEIVGNYGRSETNGRVPTLATQNFLNAVDAVAGPGGSIICRPGYVNSPATTLSSTCAPLNLFGHNTSQAARDYVTAISRPVSVNTQKIFTASINGPLLRLPGGDLSFALGYEHREEAQRFDPGDFLFGGPDPDPATDSDGDGIPDNDRVPFGQSVVIFPVNGKFNTDEVFGEIRAALVSPRNNIPAIYSLELQGAARYVDHSVAGGDLTWTAGASWQPIRDITIRGNYTRAIRAPFITEAFNPSSTFFNFADDPCDATNRNNGPSPATRQANCAADGIPANFSSRSDNASFIQSVIGNPNLDNEKSDAWTVGAVLRPRFLPGFSLSADYVDITVNDVITQFSATQVLNACYDSTAFPNGDFCVDPGSGNPRFTRAGNHQLTFVQTGYFNAAELRYKGVLVALDYRRNTPFLGADSSIAVNLSYQYLDTLTSRADEFSAPATTDGSIGYSRHQGVLSLSYNNNGFNAFAQFNYYGKAVFDPDEAPDFRTPNGVGDVVFVNTGMSYRINNRFSVRMVVDNILDQEPPFPAPVGGGTITYFPGVLGRYFRFGASIGF